MLRRDPGKLDQSAISQIGLGVSVERLPHLDDLVFALVRHCIERYGQDEITTWYWDMWNEPDIRWLMHPIGSVARS